MESEGREEGCTYLRRWRQEAGEGIGDMCNLGCVFLDLPLTSG